METNVIKTIKDVLFYYTSTTYAQEQYKKDGEVKPLLGNDPLEGHSYEIKILISESRFKAFKKAFSGAKNFPNAKDFTPEECVKKLGMEQDPEEDMVLVKFAQSVMMGKKERKRSRPVKKIGIINGNSDYDGLPILPETNIGNGTKGHLQFRPVETKFGLYLYPVAICITNLIPWITKEQKDVDEDAFGVEKKEGVKEEGSEESFDDSEIPF